MKKKLIQSKNTLLQANYVLFCVLTSLYLILLGLETHQRGFVTRSFNLTIFLGPIFFTAIILAFTPHHFSQKSGAGFTGGERDERA